ncbi:STAS domain-containing protein [Micromonospora olivasterospora]|uniref:Anti-anti-sigma regulatory factor n=1 Tax=Micromonospora olivasterospora TaxID=1880 RepID=A0A562IFT8_MICOL|nr:STAS domain-containing protein [Micromonospora olivasterospora]TWH69603.1 anti-anti-sigma regulatory factor [Micromonospora olivasterospora]
MSRMTCEVREGSPVTVVRLHGGLDLSSMRSVHRALDRCLVAQPDALVVDLGDVTVRDRLALSVFAAAARRAAGWPAVPFVLCAPPPEAASWLAESTAGRAVPVRRDVAEAARTAGAPPRPAYGPGWSP